MPDRRETDEGGSRAQYALLDELDESVLVTDEAGEIIHSNDASTELFGRDLAGAALEDVLPVENEELDDADATALSPVIDGRERHVEVTGGSLPAGISGEGSIYTIRDVTERQRYRESFRRQSERLDEVASVVSHDLRNPLMVTSARVELVRDDAPDEHVETMLRNLQEMEAMIDDLVTLARASQPVEDAQRVVLADTVRVAWASASADDCELSVSLPPDAAVEADRDRLLALFEHLFVNAADHNEDAVTVSVGHLESDGDSDGFGGFFVADDGRGIPADHRDAVFDPGYTTAEDHNGYGLAIVADVAAAHDWEATLAERDTDDGDSDGNGNGDSGTRIEIQTDGR